MRMSYLSNTEDQPGSHLSSGNLNLTTSQSFQPDGRGGHNVLSNAKHRTGLDKPSITFLSQMEDAYI